MYLGVIRCANLYLFWSREDCTVRLIHGGLQELFRRAREDEMSVPLEDMTPCKMVEDVGMGFVITMLEKSSRDEIAMHTCSLSHAGS